MRKFWMRAQEINVLKDKPSFDYEACVWGNSAILIRLADRRHSVLGLARFLKAIKGKNGKVLEVGCGTGTFLRSVKEYRPDLELFGCDISQTAINLAKENNQYPIHFETADALSLPYGDESFDVVVMMDVLEHLPNTKKALEEVRRILNKGGIFHLLVPCEANFFSLYWFMWKMNLGGNLKRKYAGHIQRLATNDVRKLLRDCDFSFVKQSFSFHGLGQIYDIFFDYLPRLFQKSVPFSSHRQNCLSIKVTLLRSLKERGTFLTIWLILGRAVEIAAYYESVALKYFTAPGLHITSRKGGIV